jgi:hypothetical protein
MKKIAVLFVILSMILNSCADNKSHKAIVQTVIERKIEKQGYENNNLEKVIIVANGLRKMNLGRSIDDGLKESKKTQISDKFKNKFEQ